MFLGGWRCFFGGLHWSRLFLFDFSWRRCARFGRCICSWSWERRRCGRLRQEFLLFTFLIRLKKNNKIKLYHGKRRMYQGLQMRLRLLVQIILSLFVSGFHGVQPNNTQIKTKVHIHIIVWIVQWLPLHAHQNRASQIRSRMIILVERLLRRQKKK